MAKVKYFRNLEGDISFFGPLDLTFRNNHHQATWTDESNGAKIIMEGKGLKASGDDDSRLGGGMIDKLTIVNGDDKTVVTYSDLHLKATTLQHVWDDDQGQAIINYLVRGNDVIVGSNADQFLLGSSGNDVMTGKGGIDYFIPQAPAAPARHDAAKVQHEHDVITDFDIKGDETDQLYMVMDYHLRAVHKGADTLVVFEDHSTVLLEHIKKAAFQEFLDEVQ